MNGQPPRSHRWKMPLRRVVWMTACGISCAPAGCQSLALNSAPLVSVSQPAQPSQQNVIVADSALRKRLFHDHWRAVEIWPESIAGPQALEELQQAPLVRWELQTVQLNETASPAETEENQDEQISRKTASKKPHREQSLQQLIDLQLLAAEDSLPGWNACIQLAWKQPRVDAQVLATLQKIALNPPRYDAKNGLVETAPAVVAELPEQPQPEWWQRPFTTAAEQLKTVGKQTAGESGKQTDDSEKTAAETTAADVKKPTASEPEWQTLSDRFRAAAAEAWCWQLHRLPGDVEQNFVAAGLALSDTDLPDLVRWELQRGIARSVPPRRVPGLSELARDQQTDRLSDAEQTLLDACITYALHNPVPAGATVASDAIMLDEQNLDPHRLWPTGLWEYRWSDNPDVVVRFGLWLALADDPLAESYLRQALQHIEPAVHAPTLRSLGLLNSDTAREALKVQSQERQGTARAIALLGLARADKATLYAALNDESATVRAAVAKFAAGEQSSRAVSVLRQLVEDDDPAVQQAAVLSVEDWQNDRAFPILAAAFERGAVPTRKLARRELETRFDLVIAALDDDAAQRRQTLQQIAQRFELSADAFQSSLQEAQSQSQQTLSSREAIPDEIRHAYATALKRWDAAPMGDVARELAEEQLADVLADYPQLFHADLDSLAGDQLAKRVELYARLDIKLCSTVRELKRDDLYQRRRSARQLSTQASEKTLPAWVCRMLAEHLPGEQDVHVCRSLMQAVEHDTTPEARLVAEAALVHAWPDVRIQGCRYVERQRLPQLAPFLLPLLHERNPSVQQAAIQAAGYCRNPLVIDGFPAQASEKVGKTGRASAGLRSLLGAVPPTVEFEVIASLARLGDDQGRTELLKLCYSPLAERRIQAIRLLAELQDSSAVDHLIRLGWTEQDPGVRTAILQGLETLVPAERRPKFPASLDARAQLEQWAEWREQRRPAA